MAIHPMRPGSLFARRLAIATEGLTHRRRRRVAGVILDALAFAAVMALILALLVVL